MSDLDWMRTNGLEEAVKEMAERIPICGICGGYQMLGEAIFDPEGIEKGGTMKGMGLLAIFTRLQCEKVRRQIQGTVSEMDGFFPYFRDSVLKATKYIWGQAWTQSRVFH